MKALDLCKRTNTTIERQFSNLIENKALNYDDPRIKLILKNGIVVYIQYNNHNHYSYSVVFSNDYLDRSRFDNYDDRWEIENRPHHYHPKGIKTAIQSPMTGNPEQDMVILFKLIKSGNLFFLNKPLDRK